MYIYTHVNECNFIDAFRQCGRLDSNFSYEGCIALFHYLDNLAGETHEPIKLDVIAFCTEFVEYESISEFNENHGTEYTSIDEIENERTVILIDGTDGFITENI